MKTIKKTALSLAIAGVSLCAHAELKSLDDSAMSALTGQAGLTIDLETKYTIGEFMYKDAGSIFLNGISFGANENVDPGGYFDNVRVKLDIAGSGLIDPANGIADNYLETGFSGVRKVAEIQALAASAAGNTDETKFLDAQSGQITVADAVSSGLIQSNATTTGPMSIDSKKTYGDGDLLIHVSYKDAWEKLGGLDVLMSTDSTINAGAASALGDVSFDDLFGNGWTKGKDFNFSIDAVGLAASTFAAGDSIGDSFTGHTSNGVDPDGDTGTTVLISDLSINGYLGPVDIHIENNGNGFGTGTATPTIGAADSKINWNTYFNVTDLDVYIDNWDGLSGVKVDNMKINNVRGDVTDLDGNFAFGFAQSKRQIFAVRNTAGFDAAGLAAAAGGSAYANPVAMANDIGLDGVAMNTIFKGDREIGALSFGDTGVSIGELYWTDMETYTNWTISGH